MALAKKSLAAALCAVFLASTAIASAESVPALNKAAETSFKAMKNEPIESKGVAASAVVDAPTPFLHRVYRPEQDNGQTIVLLHGSGGDETSLVSLARAVAPNATLLGIRGRVMQDGIQRWYRRITPTSFDQKDIRAQADAFAKFLGQVSKSEKIDLGKTMFLGYSNGANLIGALTLLHPEMIRKAVLLRAMPVLDQAPKANLSKARILTVSGDDDTVYSPFAPKLEKLLRGSGASVEARIIHSGHLLGDEDARVIGEWMAEPVLAATEQREPE